MPDGGVHVHVGTRDPVRDGVVHGLVRDHFAAFAEHAQTGGRSLPRYVEAEFEAFLRCGGFRPKEGVGFTDNVGGHGPPLCSG